MKVRKKLVKVYKITAQVELEVEFEYVENPQELNSIVGKAVAIKSGQFENMIWGSVTKVTSISEDSVSVEEHSR